MPKRLVQAALVALFLMPSGCRDDGADTYASGNVGRPGAMVSVTYFRNELSPYGRWIEYPSYGLVWVPDVWYGWRPYTAGHWAYSEYGWTWESDESWGPITYHYGRWLDDPHYGWIWVPGTTWGPAWVAWRHDDDYVGWVPLPPTAKWSEWFGMGWGRGRAARIPAEQWSFVDREDLFERDLRAHILPASRNVTVIHHTRPSVAFAWRAGRPVNRGLDPSLFERETGDPVRWKRLERAASDERDRDGNHERLTDREGGRFRWPWTRAKSRAERDENRVERGDRANDGDRRHDVEDGERRHERRDGERRHDGKDGERRRDAKDGERRNETEDAERHGTGRHGA